MTDFTRRLVMFVSAASKDAANTLMQSVTGEAADAGTFARHETLATVDYYYADMCMTEAQHTTFAAGVAAIDDFWWYEVDGDANGALLDSNDPGVDNQVGNMWRRYAEARDHMAEGVLSIDTSTLPPPTVGVAYSTTITIGGVGADAVEISAGALPTGFDAPTLTDAHTVTISGTPTVYASFTFTLQVSYGATVVTREYTLDVSFTPLSLANLVRYYERPNSAIAAASDGTGAVADGEAVGWIQDLSAAAQHAIQATADDKPLYRSADAIMGDSIDFVSSDRLQSAAEVALTDFTIFARFTVDSLAASRPIWGRAADNNNRVIIGSTGAAAVVAASVTFLMTPAVPFAIDTEYRIIITRASGALQLWKNGVKDGTATGTQTLTLDQIGRRGTANNPYDGKIKATGIYTVALSDTDCANLDAYLQLGANYDGGNGWTCDPAADAGSQGTVADPMLASEALSGAGGRIKAGHDITLNNGTHVLTANTSLGVASVYIHAANPLAATLDLTGAQVDADYGDAGTAQNIFTLTGQAVRVEDAIIISVPQIRITPQRFTYPLGFGRLWITGASPADGSGYASFKRCIIGNILDLVSYTPSAGGVVAEDTIFYDNGWDTTEVYDGEHFYTQNLEASPNKIMRRCLLGRVYGEGVQQYSESSGKVWNFVFEDITLLSEFYALSGTSRKNNTLTRLLAWKSRISNGRTDQTQTNIAVNGCYQVDADITVGRSQGGCSVNGNTIVKADGSAAMDIGENLDASLTVDNNVYWGGVTLKYAGVTYSWADWQGVLGFDLNGSYNAGLPTANSTHVVAADANSIAAGVLGQVTHYNWAEDTNITLDLDTLGVTNGQTVFLYSIDNPLGDVRELVASGTSVTLDQSTRTLSVPTAAAAALTPAIDARFSAWQVRTYGLPA